jgi:hypothetical protein
LQTLPKRFTSSEKKTAWGKIYVVIKFEVSTNKKNVVVEYNTSMSQFDFNTIFNEEYDNEYIPSHVFKAQIGKPVLTSLFIVLQS